MLLVDELLSGGMNAEHRAAGIWRFRERTEHEAAALFTRLAADLAASGAPTTLVAHASRAADDERRHAQLCRAIIDDLQPGLSPLAPDESLRLGPPASTDANTSHAARALYASVALGCVTESLSTALLLELRVGAERPVVRHAIDVILEDEVRHARLGWAHLEYAAMRSDTTWLAPSIDEMLRAALDTERLSDPGAPAGDLDLTRYGILERDTVERVCRATIEQVIVPGLARHGLARAGEWSRGACAAASSVCP